MLRDQAYIGWEAWHPSTEMAHGSVTIGLEISKLNQRIKNAAIWEKLQCKKRGTVVHNYSLALRQLRQEACKTEASLDYTERLSVLQISI